MIMYYYSFYLINVGFQHVEYVDEGPTDLGDVGQAGPWNIMNLYLPLLITALVQSIIAFSTNILWRCPGVDVDAAYLSAECHMGHLVAAIPRTSQRTCFKCPLLLPARSSLLTTSIHSFEFSVVFAIIY